MLEDGSSLGQWLRRRRERQRMTLEHVASLTKIPLRHLHALETDTLSELLPRFYQRAEVRAYAQAVGVNETRALAKLDMILGPEPTPPDPAPSPLAIYDRLVPREMRWAVLGALLLTAAVSSRLLSGPETPAPEDAGIAATTPAAAPRALSDIGGITAPVDEPPAPVEEIPAPVDLAAPAPEAGVQAPPANVPTELVVTTQPAGARVTVDGVGWGVSPVTIKYLSPGSKRIRVSKPGYSAQERSLELNDGGTRELDIRLASAQ